MVVGMTINAVRPLFVAICCGAAPIFSVTLPALEQGMLATEREACVIMIEARGLHNKPSIWGMARATCFFGHSSSMRRAVTGRTVRETAFPESKNPVRGVGGGAVERCMAFGTGNRLVLSLEWKLCCRMIEARRRIPRVNGVAGFALGADRPLVRIRVTRAAARLKTEHGLSSGLLC
jgi:hypothetical protein